MNRHPAPRSHTVPRFAKLALAAALLVALPAGCGPAAQYQATPLQDITSTPIRPTTTLHPVGSTIVLLDSSSNNDGDTFSTLVELSAIDPVSGSRLWETSFDTPVDSQVLALFHDERGLMLGINNELRFFDAHSGRVVWSQTLDEAPVDRWLPLGRRLYGTAGTHLVSFGVRRGQGLRLTELQREMVVSDVGTHNRRPMALVYEAANPSAIATVRASARNPELHPTNLAGRLVYGLVDEDGAIVVAHNANDGYTNDLYLLPLDGEQPTSIRSMGYAANCRAWGDVILCMDTSNRNRAAVPDAPWRSNSARINLSRASAFHPSRGLDAPLWSVAFRYHFGVSDVMTNDSGDIVAFDDGWLYVLSSDDGQLLSFGEAVDSSNSTDACAIVSVTDTHVIEGCYGIESPVLRARRVNFIQPEPL